MPDRVVVHWQIDPAVLTRWGVNPQGPVFRHMVALGATVETQAKRLASGALVKVRTGNLRSTISTSTEATSTRITARVLAAAPYALAVHEGTAPHTIRPRNKKVLCWRPPGGGDLVFARQVKHPGTKARPFLRDALPAINQ
jgi:hypothetical protein